MHTVKCNKFSIYFVKRNNWVTPTDWVNNTDIYRYSSLDWSDFAENNFDTQCIKVESWFLVLLKRSRRIRFSFFETSCLLDYQDHFQNPRISLRTSTTIYFKLVASTECMIGFLSNYREHSYVQEIHEASPWALHEVSFGTLSVAYCQDITRSVRSISQAFLFKVFPTPHPRNVHFYIYFKRGILRLKLNSSQGAFKNLFCDFAATFVEIWIKCPSEWICFDKNTSLFNKQIG